MNANKALWEKGDFTQIAASMRHAGDALVREIGISAGMRVLDLGCGDGTTALPATELGADVLGVDIATNLVAAGNARARAAGLTNLRFEEGDAADLHNLANRQFDLVVTVFGAMFAPRPHDVAREMVRVTKPGGRIVMANWIPGDPTLVAQIFRISAAYSPPPPEGFVSPLSWGVESNVIERFGAAGVTIDRIVCVPGNWAFGFDLSSGGVVDVYRSYFGPTMNAFAAAEASGRAERLQQELVELFERQNCSGREDRTDFVTNFLKVTVRV